MKPTIGITIGDPAGIGPEIVAKALQHADVYESCVPVVIGDAGVMRRACEIVGAEMSVNAVDKPSRAAGEHGGIDVLDLDNIDTDELQMGVVQAACGKAAFDYIERAVALAKSGEIEAITTGPINKESLRAAEVAYIGHTEILGALTDSHDPLTLFEVDGMRIFFLSRHVSLRKAIDMVTEQRVLDYLRRCSAALSQLGVERSDIAVAGLNPHCGENGMFGDEELREISPAIEKARAEGLDVIGPIGADSIFHLALQGRFGAVLSLYHDQGHIASKTYDFYRTVSVTLGLPILRTSVDHGTAFDVAGTARARADGMREAILSAARYAPSFVAADVKV